MVFSSITFILWFLPIFLIIYYIIPSDTKYGMTLKNTVLLVGSLIFYAYGEPLYVFLMIASIVFNYYMAGRIDYYSGWDKMAGRRKLIFVLTMIFNIGLLFFFKYADFLICNINLILARFGGPAIPMVGLEMPIGISFYTFQILSYVVDVYYARYEAETDVIRLGTYIAMFPQLIAGPIVKYTEVKKRLSYRFVTAKSFNRGLRVFIYGLGAKVIIANHIGALWTEIGRIGYESISTKLAWIGAFAYSFQIYFDFWGYSLMAIGLGIMLGFRIPKNFDNPYISKSATEFWRRWHMTLGRWFKEYLYIPLGGNREGKAKLIRNTFIVWLLTGLWHGADWNFVIWGLGFFVLIMLEKLFLKKYLDKLHVLPHLYMWFIIPISWVVFAISDLRQLGIYMTRLFPFIKGNYDSNVNPNDYINHGKPYLIFFVLAIIFCIPKKKRELIFLKNSVVGVVAPIIVFIISMYYLSLGLDNPFMYYRF